MKTNLFDYHLPPELIAQQPTEPRDSSRLLVLHKKDGRIEHRRFGEIGDYLRTGDLLVANDSRVIPARLHGSKPTGGAVEIFLLRQLDETGQEWECLIRGKKLVEGSTVEIGRLRDWEIQPISQSPNLPISARIIAVHQSGARTVRFSTPIKPYLEELGEVPLPPYITQYSGDRERYQTIYSQPEGSVAAPTAGLHFTPELLVSLRQAGVLFETVTLHVGLDTFKPVTVEEIEDHQIHTEWAELSSATARHINEASLQGGRVVAIGTTTARTLEWAATSAQGIDPYRRKFDAQVDSNNLQSAIYNPQSSCPWQRVAAFEGDVSLFIQPGYRFRAVDMLITNFHLPRSSLLMMVSTFIGHSHPDDRDAGRRILLQTYEAAKREGYHFFSFGDAMLIL